MLDGVGVRSHNSILTIGVDAHVVRVCLLEPVEEQTRLVGWQERARETTLIPEEQIAALCVHLGTQLGRPLWNEDTQSPQLQSHDSLHHPPLSQVYISATVCPPLRVWLVGLSEGISLAVAGQAVAASLSQNVGTTALDMYTNVSTLAAGFVVEQPDTIVICGGYEHSDTSVEQSLEKLCGYTATALNRFAPGQRPNIIYAGKSSAAEQIQRRFQDALSGVQFDPVENIQPSPGHTQLNGLVQALSHHYWRLCQRIPSFKQLTKWETGTGQIVSQESSFIQLVRAWMVYQNLPQLHGMHCTPDRWLHVWAQYTYSAPYPTSSRSTENRESGIGSNMPVEPYETRQLEHQIYPQIGVSVCYTEPGPRPSSLESWPMVQLVSGAWPAPHWTPPENCWWDSSGMAPTIATLGQTEPRAMLQVLNTDLFERRGQHVIS